MFKEFIDNIKEAFSTPANITFSVLDLLVTILIVYCVVIFLKKNNATRFIKYLAIVAVLAVVVASDYVKMPLTAKIMVAVVFLILVSVFILFSQEVKRSLWKLASPKNAENSYTTQYDCSDEELHVAIDGIVRAVQNMSKKDVGALIVIAPDNIPEHILDSGTRLNSQLSCPLLECLFNTKAPLHDGAVYVRGNKILAAGCFLPLTQQTNLDKELGTRHRAALGITEQCNHLAIIVSEETGIISVARNGEIMRYFDSQMLTDVLEQIYGLKAVSRPNKHSKRRTN